MSVTEEAAGQDAGAATAGQLPGGSRLFALPLAVALATIVCTYWTIDIVSPALPIMKEDLELSAASAGLIYSLLFFGRLIGNFPAAYLLSRLGTAGTAALGGAILVLSTSAAAVAPSGLWLSPARIVQGIGISLLINACLRAILGAKPGRGDAMTYFGFAATVGGVLGLQSGGYLSDEVGWRSVFVLSAVIAGAITLAVVAGRMNAARTGTPVDPVVSRQTTVENRTGSVFPPLLFNFLVFFNYSPFVALPLYAEHEFGASGEQNARLLMVITVTHLLAAFPAGRAIRHWGAQRCLVAGMVIALAGTALVLPAPGLRWIAAPLVLYGIGQVSATSAGGDIVLHLGRQSPRAVGLVRFSSDLGLVIGPYVTGALSDHYGYGAPFVALPIMMAVATLLALVRAFSTGESGK